MGGAVVRGRRGKRLKRVGGASMRRVWADVLRKVATHVIPKGAVAT
jgi:hypothetical protein